MTEEQFYNLEAEIFDDFYSPKRKWEGKICGHDVKIVDVEGDHEDPYAEFECQLYIDDKFIYLEPEFLWHFSLLAEVLNYLKQMFVK